MAVVYVCPVCNYETQPMEPPPPSPCPNCEQDAEPLQPKDDQPTGTPGDPPAEE